RWWARRLRLRGRHRGGAELEGAEIDAAVDDPGEATLVERRGRHEAGVAVVDAVAARQQRERRREAAVVGQWAQVGDTGDGDDAGRQDGVLAEVDAVDQVAVAVNDGRVGALAVDHLGGQIALPSVSADDAVVQGQGRADGAARLDVVAEGQGVDA